MASESTKTNRDATTVSLSQRLASTFYLTIEEQQVLLLVLALFVLGIAAMCWHRTHRTAQPATDAAALQTAALPTAASSPGTPVRRQTGSRPSRPDRAPAN